MVLLLFELSSQLSTYIAPTSSLKISSKPVFRQISTVKGHFSLNIFWPQKRELATKLLELFKPLKLAAAVIESMTPEMLAHSSAAGCRVKNCSKIFSPAAPAH